MNILIVDADRQSSQSLRALLLKLAQKPERIHIVPSLEAGYDLLKSESINAVFVDIGLSVELDFKQLRKFKEAQLDVVFILNDSIEAVKVLAQHDLKFLTKPLKLSDLANIMLTIQAKITAQHFAANRMLDGKPNRIELKDKDGIRFVEIDQIYHCTSDNNYTEIYLETGERIISAKTLKEHSSMLEPYGFFRVHQSHLVDLKRVKKVINKDGLFVGLENGTVVELSRRRKDKLMQKLRSLRG